jgi:hypothetical protein
MTPSLIQPISTPTAVYSHARPLQLPHQSPSHTGMPTQQSARPSQNCWELLLICPLVIIAIPIALAYGGFRLFKAAIPG